MELIIPKGRKTEKEGNTMKMLTIMLLVMAGISLVMGIGMVYAAEDTNTQTSTPSLTIPAHCKLLISNANPEKTLTANGTAEAAFDAGYVEMDAENPTLRVFANKKWKLTASSAGFGAVDGYTKATGDLLLKDAGASHVTMSSYAALTGADQEVASHTIGVNNESHPCQYKILLDYTKDIPGIYQAIVTYTLATQAS